MSKHSTASWRRPSSGPFHHHGNRRGYVLRWHIQKGVVPIPKATSVARQIQNKEVFDFTLEHEDIEKINTLTQKDGRLKGQDPAVYEEF